MSSDPADSKCNICTEWYGEMHVYSVLHSITFSFLSYARRANRSGLIYSWPQLL